MLRGSLFIRLLSLHQTVARWARFFIRRWQALEVSLRR